MQNTNEPVETAEGLSPNVSGQKPTGGMSQMLKWLIGIVILAGIGYGGWYLGQNQKSNISAPGGSDSVGKSQNDISKLKSVETPTTTEVTTPASKNQEPPTKNEVVTTPDPTADWKTYNGEYYGEKYSFKYPLNYKVTFGMQEEGTVTDEFDKYIFGIGLSACSVPNSFPQLVFSHTLNEYKSDGIYKLPDNNGCLSINYQGGYKEDIIDQILSTFKFTN